ncbi:MAG: hypothetical protein IT340_02850 [Chloroflexi bacterium]|nr:hypothetical protein [Chloroflexota bacterium]
MNLFRGLPGTDYQDVLRALGHFLDERGFRHVRVIEHEEGLLIQAMPVVEGKVSNKYETFLLTDAAIQRLLTLAYERRQPGVGVASPGPATGLTGLLPRQRVLVE